MIEFTLDNSYNTIGCLRLIKILFNSTDELIHTNICHISKSENADYAMVFPSAHLAQHLCASLSDLYVDNKMYEISGFGTISCIGNIVEVSIESCLLSSMRGA